MPSPISLRGKSRKKGKDSNSSSEDEVLPSSQVQATPFRHLRNRRSKRGTLVEDLSSSSGNSEGGDNEQIIKAVSEAISKSFKQAGDISTILYL